MAKSRKKYRYCLTGVDELNNPVKDYYLLAANNFKTRYDSYCGEVVIKVCVDTIELKKLTCDDYSTTKSTKTLAELEGQAFIYTGYEWVKAPHDVTECERLKEQYSEEYRKNAWRELEERHKSH